jgi:hypothetical protein
VGSGRKAHGDAEGTRARIEALLLHRHMTHDHVVSGIAAALKARARTVDVVALEPARLPTPTTPPPTEVGRPTTDLRADETSRSKSWRILGS